MSGLEDRLRRSLADQERLMRSTLILNPVENVPFAEDIAVLSGPLHGLYNSDKVRNHAERMRTPIQFAGRRSIEEDSRAIYEAWATALGAEAATLRVLSGLHAHIVLLMALARPGQSILMLPIEGGGHLSGNAIAERLGLRVIDMVIDRENMRIDLEATLDRCADDPPDFVFVDRSEGLVVEDVGLLARLEGAVSIFDASQYLSNIIAGDHPNPFGLGFDLVIASVHKNFPGPQKALLATRCADERWDAIVQGVSVYVSNMHPASTYAAGLALCRSDWLRSYSKRMLGLAVRLEDDLLDRGLPVVRRSRDLVPTHHVWLKEPTPGQAFSTYESLERCRILTNFRVLPYALGHGVRLGLSAAARLGMDLEDTSLLADLIARIRQEGPTDLLVRQTRSFNEQIWERAVH